MTNTDKQLIPTAYSREVNVDSTFAYMGSLMTFLAKGSETSGRFALMEYHTKPGNEPPPHVHDREHELYFVLEGASALLLRGQDPRHWSGRHRVSSPG